MEAKFQDILDRYGFLGGPEQVGRQDVRELVKEADHEGVKDEFIEWMMGHPLRFGVRSDLQEARYAT